MIDRVQKIGARFGIYSLAFVVGAMAMFLFRAPFDYVWAIFLGDEIQSAASFPLGHIARVYSAPGIGDQQLILTVDGRQVFRTGDFQPGDVDEELVWDESGDVVTLFAAGQKLYSYNARTGIGRKEE